MRSFFKGEQKILGRTFLKEKTAFTYNRSGGIYQRSVKVSVYPIKILRPFNCLNVVH